MDERIAAKAAGRISPFKLAGMYVGTVVGAGFASGQEVLQFFGYHGVSGLWGIALAGALFVVFGAIILILGHRLRATSHLEVVRASGIPWIGTIVDAVITFFLLGAFSAMAAGAGAVFEEQFGVPYLWGSIAMVVVTIATVILGIEGVVTAISAVAPFLLGSVLLVSLLSVTQSPVNFAWSQPDRAAVAFWPLSSLTYASYNLVFAIALLAPAGTLGSPKTLRKGAVLGGFGLGLGALAIYLTILTGAPEVAAYDIPMLFLARRALGPLATLYSAVLLAEVYTTAVASLYGFVARVTDPKGNRFLWAAVASGVVGFAGSLLGFSELVAKVYSGVGFAGSILLVTLLVAYFRRPAAGHC